MEAPRAIFTNWEILRHFQAVWTGLRKEIAANLRSLAHLVSRSHDWGHRLLFRGSASRSIRSREGPARDAGRDRGGAAGDADGNPHRRRVRGPGQIGVLRRRNQRVSLGPRGVDQHMQGHAIDHTGECEHPKSARSRREGSRRDGRAEGADLQCHRLGGRIYRVAGAPQGEARLSFKRILVDRKLGAEGAERYVRNNAHAPGAIFHRKRGLHGRGVGGRVDHRDPAGGLRRVGAHPG